MKAIETMILEEKREKCIMKCVRNWRKVSRFGILNRQIERF